MSENPKEWSARCGALSNPDAFSYFPRQCPPDLTPYRLPERQMP
jgi:hypothetical protein